MSNKLPEIPDSAWDFAERFDTEEEALYCANKRVKWNHHKLVCFRHIGKRKGSTIGEHWDVRTKRVEK